MARFANAILRVVAATDAIRAQLDVDDMQHTIGVGENWLANFTYTMGDPALRGNFTMAWSAYNAQGSAVSGVTPPSFSFSPASPPALDTAYELPTTLRAGYVQGTVNASTPVGTRFAGTISVTQPDPAQPPPDWSS